MPSKKEEKAFLSRVGKWKAASESSRRMYEYRWARNIKLAKGIFDDEEASRSKVRNRSKIFFRKIWAVNWRLLASFYNAFLREKDSFRTEGRMGNDGDDLKAEVLQTMVEYRRDRMMRNGSLFKKLIFGLQDIENLGWCVGLLWWEYNEELGIDEPRYNPYPLEQVFPDMTATTKEEMRFCILESFVDKEDLEIMGYSNVGKARPEMPPFSQVRQARHYNANDPLQDPKEKEYPAPGRYNDGSQKQEAGGKYREWKIFYKENGRCYYAVTNGADLVFKEPELSWSGNRYPIVFGECLIEAHKLFGEGFNEPQEGPQVSFNANLNQRKDNVALALNRGTIVSRYGNVDIKSLINSRPGNVTLADDPNAVKEREHVDVTQSSYTEAAADEAMMQEMTGVTPSKQGMGTETKATVAQINQIEGSAKIDLYIAIVGETFIRDFYSTLAYLIQKFETDEKVFRIANTQFIRNHSKSTPENMLALTHDTYDIDFEADIVVNVGFGAVSRGMEIQQTLLAMDRAIMSNQSLIALLGTGLVKPDQKIRIFNTSEFTEYLLEKLGHKNTSKFYLEIGGGPSGGQSPAGAGSTTPQMGNLGIENLQNSVQGGSLGGV